MSCAKACSSCCHSCRSQDARVDVGDAGFLSACVMYLAWARSRFAMRALQFSSCASVKAFAQFPSAFACTNTSADFIAFCGQLKFSCRALRSLHRAATARMSPTLTLAPCFFFDSLDEVWSAHVRLQSRRQFLGVALVSAARHERRSRIAGFRRRALDMAANQPRCTKLYTYVGAGRTDAKSAPKKSCLLK